MTCMVFSSRWRSTEIPHHAALPSRPRLSHNHSVTPRELANSICDTLRVHGYQPLLGGGCARDLLLGREPADYDVATDATPDQARNLFPARGTRADALG